MKTTKWSNPYMYFAPMNFNWGDEPAGWEQGYQFRIRISYGDEEIKFEDTCNRMVPICFEDIRALRKALKKVEKHIISQAIGHE